jgi:hypothetical protein
MEMPERVKSFLRDTSRSMYQMDKMDCVKESFDIYIHKMRDKDFVSLVVFDVTARVVFPSTQMKGEGISRGFREAVHSIVPGGGSNLIAGLQLGYKELLSNYRNDYMNQVLFLTDGVGRSEEMYELAATYREVGINVTAIGLGEDCDLGFIDSLADWGGGGSRFIAGREQMEEIFGTEFGKMVIPAARDVEIELYLLQNLRNVTSWGYHAEIEDLWDSYADQEGKPPFPYGITPDTSGDVYVADYENDRVQKYDKEGTFLMQRGGPGNRNGQFNEPIGLAVNSRRPHDKTTDMLFSSYGKPRRVCRHETPGKKSK